MNKYTLKIINFILENPIENINNIPTFENHELITHIKNKYNQISDENETLLKKNITYNKLHEISEECYIYTVIKKLHNDNHIKNINSSDLENIYVFNNWYRENHMNVNLYNILHRLKNNKKYKTFYDHFYKCNDDKRYLYELIYLNSFISLDNVQHAESSDILYKNYTNRYIDCHFYYPLKNNTNLEEININLVNKIFLFMSSLFEKPNKKLKLIVFYGNQKKIIDYNNNILCSDNVNSGLSDKSGLIMIWRKEEFYKVFIHELIHFFGIDFYVLDDLYNKINRIFQSKYKIIGIDRINESYTEALAILLHSILYAIEKNVQFEKIIKNEIMFSHIQIAKILNYYGSNSLSDLEQLNFKQNTSVFSYYIIKTMLMANYQKLFSFWITNGFELLNKNENKYENLYGEMTNINDIDVNTINFFINYFKNNNSKKNSFIFKTMRMSCYSF